MHVGLSRDGIGRDAIASSAVKSCYLCGRNEDCLNALISCLSPLATKLSKKAGNCDCGSWPQCGVSAPLMAAFEGT